MSSLALEIDPQAERLQYLRDTPSRHAKYREYADAKKRERDPHFVEYDTQGKEVEGRSPFSASGPDQRPKISSYVSEREWDGYVTNIADNIIFGLISPIGDSRSTDRSIVEIPMKQVDPEDRALVVDGAKFRLSVGYEALRVTSSKGTRRGSTSVTSKNAVRLYFRRASEQSTRDLGWIREGIRKLHSKAADFEVADMMSRVE